MYFVYTFLKPYCQQQTTYDFMLEHKPKEIYPGGWYLIGRFNEETFDEKLVVLKKKFKRLKIVKRECSLPEAFIKQDLVIQPAVKLLYNTPFKNPFA